MLNLSYIKTTQNTYEKADAKSGNTIFVHRVNFVSARWTCTQCADVEDIDVISRCQICAPIEEKNGLPYQHYKRTKTFSMYDTEDKKYEPLSAFVDW